jgi:hypothetical protein
MGTLYLDSRDLIRLVSRDEPMAAGDFAAVLAANQDQLVYSFANICELVIVDDLLETRRRLRVLDELPHTYIIALPPATCLEFRSAVTAFENGHDTALIDPFVPQWHQTYRYPGQANYQDLLVNYSLLDQVLPIAMNNPDLCRNLQRRALVLQEAVAEDRMLTNAVRRNRARFEGGVRQHLTRCQIPMQIAALPDFARWIHNNPARCPGWRIFYETYLEFCTNVEDQVDAGDVRDFSHVACLPYVDAITLDRRMAGYCRAGAMRLREQNAAVDYVGRIFADSAAWLVRI